MLISLKTVLSFHPLRSMAKSLLQNRAKAVKTEMTTYRYFLLCLTNSSGALSQSQLIQMPFMVSEMTQNSFTKVHWQVQFDHCPFAEQV